MLLLSLPCALHCVLFGYKSWWIRGRKRHRGIRGAAGDPPSGADRRPLAGPPRGGPPYQQPPREDAQRALPQVEGRPEVRRRRQRKTPSWPLCPRTRSRLARQRCGAVCSRGFFRAVPWARRRAEGGRRVADERAADAAGQARGPCGAGMAGSPRAGRPGATSRRRPVFSHICRQHVATAANMRHVCPRAVMRAWYQDFSERWSDCSFVH